MNVPKPVLRTIAVAVLLLGSFALLLASLGDLELCQTLFLRSTYYIHLALVMTWLGLVVAQLRLSSLAKCIAWIVSHRLGLGLALLITIVIGMSVDPALRVLSDEANLVGISKNLFSSKSPTFTLSGKYYYENYWDVDVVIDQRPTLFSFLVSLAHGIFGYSIDNVFRFNLLVLFLFLFRVYEFGKDLGGATLGSLFTLLSVAHPILLLSARSGGFDFLATFFTLLTLSSFLRFLREDRPLDLALLWIHLCLFASTRYESALFIVPIVTLLAVFGSIRGAKLRPYALVYAASPAFLFPRLWLSLLRGNVPPQDPGSVTFSVGNFLANAEEYFLPLLNPWGHYPAHSAIVIALGLVGSAQWLTVRGRRTSGGTPSSPTSRFALVALAWLTTHVVIVLAYIWGRAQYPSAARLVLPLDLFFSFIAAWSIAHTLGRHRARGAVLLSLAIALIGLPVASRDAFTNELTESRENAEVWRFFRKLNERRILVVSGRPVHFTIMNYGAMTYSAARQDPHLLTALDRRLFEDVYLVQHIELSSGKPVPGQEFWSDRTLQTVHEFQNEADVLVRIAKIERKPFLKSE